MKRQPPRGGPQIEDVDVHYGPGTRPQGALPFSRWVRRKYRWWPGSEVYAPIVDRLLVYFLLIPLVIWIGLSFGWMAATFTIAQAIVLIELFFKVANGTILGK